MSIITRILGRQTAVVPERIEPPLRATAQVSAPTGTQNPQPWLQTFVGGVQSRVRSLPHVTPISAQRHATVFACCNVIAGDLSKVPLEVHQRDSKGGFTHLVDHPVNYLLNTEASPGVPAMVARFALVYAFCLRGRAYGYAPRDGSGEVVLLDVIRQELCSELVNGRERFYDFMDGGFVYRRASNRSMVHMRYMAADGWTGRSPLEVAAESVGLALAGQEAAARAASGTQMRAYAKLDDLWDDEEKFRRNARRLRASLNDPESNGIPIVGVNEDITSLDLSAADQQLLESRKFDREQIAAIYRVPPMKLQALEHGVKSNGQQQSIDYKADCLLHWGGFVERQMALGLLTERERRSGMVLKHNYEALMEATTKERYDAATSAAGGPVLTPNEARKSIGFGPVKGGDLLNPAPNMTRKDPASAPKN